MTKAKRFLAENSLSLFFLALFLAALVGQAIAGHSLYNQEQSAHGEAAIGFWRYVTSSSFGQAVMENWQSEYLQFAYGRVFDDPTAAREAVAADSSAVR